MWYGTTAVVVSLTHVCIDDGHPLAKRIKTYQSTRSRKIAMMNSVAKQSQFTVKPGDARPKRGGRHSR
jgi:hypothetical protein